MADGLFWSATTGAGVNSGVSAPAYAFVDASVSVSVLELLAMGSAALASTARTVGDAAERCVCVAPYGC